MAENSNSKNSSKKDFLEFVQNIANHGNDFHFRGDPHMNQNTRLLAKSIEENERIISDLAQKADESFHKTKENIEDINKIEEEINKLKASKKKSKGKEKDSIEKEIKEKKEQLLLEKKKLSDNTKASVEYERQRKELLLKTLPLISQERREREWINKQETYIIKSLKEGVTFEEKQTMWLDRQLEKRKINHQMFRNGFSEIKKGFGEFKGQLTSLLDIWGKIDQTAFSYTKTVGGNATSAKNFRANTIGFVNSNHIGARYNTSADELIKMQEKYNNSIGRTVKLTNQQLEGMAAMKAVMGEDKANEFATRLETFGLDTTTAEKKAGEMFAEASAKGIVFEQYSKNFLDNIKLAQNYSFTNGVKGLQAMAERATAIKLNMQQIAQFADKVSTVEGSIQASASLSVLGGPFAINSNPMSLMYQGLNNPEELEKTFEKMFGDFAKWNSEKKMVDVSAFNRQRIRAAAQATGMNYDDVMTSVMTQGRRKVVEKQLNSTRSGKLNKETREFVLNNAQLDENGNAYVTMANGEKKSISKVTNSDLESMQKAAQSESEDIKEIATTLRGWNDMKEGFKKQWENTKANIVETLHLGDTAKGFLGFLGDQTALLQIIAAATTAMAFGGGVLAMGNGMKNMFGTFGSGVGKTAVAKSGNLPIGTKLAKGVHMGKNGQFYKKGVKGAISSNKAIVPKIGAKVIGGAALGGVVSGVFTGINEFYGSNKNRDSTSEKVGKTLGTTAGTTLGAWGGAAAGAAIGTAIAPGIGTVIGGFIGSMIGGAGGGAAGNYLGGLVGGTDSEKADIMRKNGLGHLNGAKDGYYTMDEIREMIDRNPSVELQTKMQRRGDLVLYNNRDTFNTPQYAKGYIPDKGGVSIAKGKSHSEGGILANIGGRLSEIEGGEAVISKSKVSQYLPELKAINAGIMPRLADGLMPVDSEVIGNAMGKQISSLSVEKTDNKIDQKFGPSEISFKPLDVNFSGTIKLDLGKQSANIDIKELISNNDFKQEVTKMLFKEMQRYSVNTGNLKENTFRHDISRK